MFPEKTNQRQADGSQSGAEEMNLSNREEKMEAVRERGIKVKKDVEDEKKESGNKFQI